MNIHYDDTALLIELPHKKHILILTLDFVLQYDFTSRSYCGCSNYVGTR